MKYLLILAIALGSAASRGFPTGSIQVCTPQRMNLSLGYCLSGPPFLGPSSGFLVRAEPGISGGKLHLGLRSVFGMMSLPVASADITGALLSTWNDPWGGVEAGQTYVGGEFRLGIRYIVLSAGYYIHTAGNGEESPLWSLGAGLGI